MFLGLLFYLILLGSIIIIVFQYATYWVRFTSLLYVIKIARHGLLRQSCFLHTDTAMITIGAKDTTITSQWFEKRTTPSTAVKDLSSIDWNIQIFCKATVWTG